MFGLFDSSPVACRRLSAREMLRDDRPSLFLAVWDATASYGQLPDVHENKPYGYLDDVGFACAWSDPLMQGPVRSTEYRLDFVSDRFFRLRAGDCGDHLARIEIDEFRAVDNVLRGDINITGFKVAITLCDAAFEPFTRHLDLVKPRDPLERIRFVMRIPMESFEFPAQRGNPYASDRAAQVTDMRIIQHADVREMVVAAVKRRDGYEVKPGTLLERYELGAAWHLIRK